MKKTKRIMIVKGLILTVLLSIAGILPAAQANAAGEEVSGNSVSSDSPATEGTSDNSAPVISISVNEAKSSDGKKVYDIKTSDTESGIALIQAENTKAGVRSTLFQADDLYRELSEEVKEELRAITPATYTGI